MFGHPARSLGFMLLAVWMLSSGGTVDAATTTFTNRSAFESSLPAGYYSNNFSSTPDAFSSPVASVTGTGGTPSVGYTITAPPSGLGVFPDTGFKAVGNWNSANSMVVTFDTGNVASAGADIWLSDINGTRVSGTVTVNFSDGSSVSVPSTTTGAFGFAGITSGAGTLSSMTVVGTGGSSYLNMTNLSAAVVPEPSSIVTGICGLVGLGVAGLKRRRTA